MELGLDKKVDIRRAEKSILGRRNSRSKSLGVGKGRTSLRS
jgi:hypothetical protein